MNAQFREELTKATQTASMLLGDIQAAHHHAVAGDRPAGNLAGMILLDLLAEARKVADKLKQMQDVI